MSALKIAGVSKTLDRSLILDEVDTLKNSLRFADCVKEITPGAVTGGDKQSFTFTLTQSCM